MLKTGGSVRLRTFVTSDLGKILTTPKIERFIKLKMRNVIKQLKLKTLTDLDYWQNATQLYFTFMIVEYNQSLGIYSGYIELEMEHETYSARNYHIVYAVAGHKTQIIGLIKTQLGTMIERLAEDFYYIEDIAEKNPQLFKKYIEKK
jgi:hypothetical protein